MSELVLSCIGSCKSRLVLDELMWLDSKPAAVVLATNSGLPHVVLASNLLLMLQTQGFIMIRAGCMMTGFRWNEMCRDRI